MSFAEVKGAINSTLGTSEFKPLDQMIIGSKGLRASENFYSRVLSDSGVVDGGNTYEIKLKMNWQGSLNIRYTSESYQTGAKGATFSIYVNDSLKFTESDYDGDRDSGIITFSKGDEIRITYSVPAHSSTSWGRLKTVDIYADMTDLSAYTIVE